MKPHEDESKPLRRWKIVTSLVSSCDGSSVSSWAKLAVGQAKKMLALDPDQIFITEISTEKLAISHCYAIALSDENWLEDFELWERHTAGEYFIQHTARRKMKARIRI